MLNIGKLRGDAADYYLAKLATSVDEYYTGRGEAPGRWLGRGADALQLRGVVDPPVLRQVLGGRQLDSGEALLSRHRRVPGFDLTFRPPKSVSLLWALTDQDISLQVRRAHDAAVEAAMDYLERHAAYTRRGRGGVEQVKVDGFVAAAFRHRVSRAEDPLLHTHVLVANLAYTPADGKWRTLDARQLYLHAKTAGYLYQTHLRAELTRRLGVHWGPIVNGCADLAGVPREVIDAFSRRRADIVASLAERGHHSAKAAQIATLATRRTKQPVDDGIHRHWRQRAAVLGFDAQQVARVSALAPTGEPDRVWVEGTLERLLGPSGLTAKASTFTRRDALQAWCQNLRAGAAIARVEELTDRLLDPSEGGVVALNRSEGPVRQLERGDVVRLADGRPIPGAPSEVRYTTLELLAIEERLIGDAVGRLDASTGTVPEQIVEETIAGRPTLATEQVAAVRQLTRSGAGVEVVVGKAGSGKTYMLAATRDAWKTAGFQVIGCALAARAALELQTGSGIPSTTIDRLLADLQQDGGALTAASVVVVDEAAMVGTRTLARLLAAASTAGAKVVLVGDHHQLPEIHTGGAFAGLVNRLPAIELTVNRRQQHRWERNALNQLRAGDVVQAIDAYEHHDRILDADTAANARDRLVGDWWQARGEHGADAVMVAATRADVNDLNARARQHMATTGGLTGPELLHGGRAFQVGDQIVCLRNRRQLGVVNGQRGTVTAVHPERGTLTFLPDHALNSVRLPAAYLDGGCVDHGYALTAHKAQGMTCQATFVYATDAIYREWGYVALSRGRTANHLYMSAGPDPDPLDDPTHPQAHETDDLEPAAALTACLRRSGQQALALDHLAQPQEERKTQPPAYIRALLGGCPNDASRQRLWLEAATAVERYRRDRDITDLDQPLGTPPRDLPGREAYREIIGVVVAARGRVSAPAHCTHEAQPDLGIEMA